MLVTNRNQVFWALEKDRHFQGKRLMMYDDLEQGTRFVAVQVHWDGKKYHVSSLLGVQIPSDQPPHDEKNFFYGMVGVIEANEVGHLHSHCLTGIDPNAELCVYPEGTFWMFLVNV